MNYKILYRFPLAIIYLIELLFKDFFKFFFKSKNNNLSNKGYEILVNFLSKNDIKELNNIDKVLRSKLVNENSSGSIRIYNFHREYKLSDNLQKKLYNFASEHLNLKFNKIMESQYQVSLPSEELPLGFGWHVDDYDSIIKFFYFPTQVNESNGPLRILEGTVRYQNYFQAFKTLVFRRTFIDKYYDESSIKDELLKKEKKLILKENSLVAIDTSSLHSSSVLEKGERRVMVFSFRSAR
tara:strand:- start:2988 stop:3704 length:717 start_codon:yes stop_codon:yes gene_type:complete